MFKISVTIWVLWDKINVAKLFLAKSPSFAKSKEGDLPLLYFSSLTYMILNFL